MSGDVPFFEQPSVEEKRREPHLSAVFYEKDTGKIVGMMQAKLDDLILNCPKDQVLYLGEWDPEMWYINIQTGKHEQRPKLDQPHPVNNMLMFKFPVISMIRVIDPDGVSTEVQDDDLTLVLDDPGTYSWIVRPPFPYLNLDGKVTV